MTSDPDYCSLVLVNDGVRISESGREAVVEVKDHGPAEGFSCVLDSGEQLAVSMMHAHIWCVSLVNAHSVCMCMYVCVHVYDIVCMCRFRSSSSAIRSE